jgi:DNA-binding transcriptional regulator GbsR (MarR family)
LINQIFVNYSCRINNVAILKELKELKMIVADTQRELEREKQEREREKREFKHKNQELKREKRELEQLRSYLTASAPLQEIDSLQKFASTIW